MLIKQLNDSAYLFWCPGCDDSHVVDNRWTFNGDFDRPTLTPSYYDYQTDEVCHLFVSDGKIIFLKDSTHHLSEKTVPLGALPAWISGESDPEPPAEDLEDSEFEQISRFVD